MEKKYTEVDLAYIAGLFDGEGSVGIYHQVIPTAKRGYTYRYQINISNNCLPPLKRIQELFGGGIYSHGWKNSKWKESHEWRVTGGRSTEVLLLLLPYLQIKYPQAELFIKCQKFRDGLPYPGRSGWDSKTWLILKRYHDEMHNLNQFPQNHK